MLRQHLRASSAESRHRAVIVFESGMAPDVTFLGLSGWNSPRSAEIRWKAVGPVQSGCVQYFNAWGAGFLAPHDRSQRRVTILATAWPGDETYLSLLKGRFDMVLVVSEQLADLAKRCLGLPDDRIVLVPVPIDPPVLPPRFVKPWLGRPLVLGYIGRLVTAQKRVERLPQIGRELLRAGIEHRWEIIGDGPARSELERQFSEAGATVDFRGRLGGEDYWRAVRELDFIVFTSDYEGTPLSLAEAMSQGVLPLYARMNSGGDAYARRLHPDLLFEAGQPESAARGILEVMKLSADRQAAMQADAIEIAQHHRSYVDQCEVAIRRAWEMPRISLPVPPTVGSFWGRRLPFGIISRLSHDHPLRRGIG